MTIYIPRHFAGDEAAALQLVADHPFATLVTSVAGGEPHVTHIPLLLEDGALCGHLARPNPHWRQFAHGATVAIFHGPHAFVAPTWYEQPAANVPTWNYAVVHVHGRPEALDGARNLAHLERLFARLADGARLPTEPARLERLLGGIVAFRMPIDRIEAKFKMSQNKTAADRAGVIAGLRASGRADELATARWMETHDA